MAKKSGQKSLRTFVSVQMEGFICEPEDLVIVGQCLEVPGDDSVSLLPSADVAFGHGVASAYGSKCYGKQ